MIKGFREFILRGNVIDLAVAVVIGAAFGAVVTSFTDKIVNPIIASLGGAKADGLGFRIVAGNANTFVDFGAVITAVSFLIIALVIYLLLVLPMNKLAECGRAHRDCLPARVGAARLTGRGSHD